MNDRRKKCVAISLAASIALGALSGCGGWRATGVSAPEPLTINLRITEVSTGWRDSYMITEDGSLWAWGAFGGVFEVTEEDWTRPIRVMEDVTAISDGMVIGVMVRSGAGVTTNEVNSAMALPRTALNR